MGLLRDHSAWLCHAAFTSPLNSTLAYGAAASGRRVPKQHREHFFATDALSVRRRASIVFSFHKHTNAQTRAKTTEHVLLGKPQLYGGI
jgi:hypothetical protein